MARADRITLVEASLLTQLERLNAGTKRASRSHGGTRSPRRNTTARTAEQSVFMGVGVEGENYPLEQFLSKLLLSEEGTTLHLLIDSSQSMKFRGFGGHGDSSVSKFDLARKVGAALGYIALARRGSVRVFGFDAIRRRHAASLRDKEAIPALLAHLEQLSSGGVTNFAHSLDNYMRRTQSQGVYLVLSDFVDSDWAEAIGALVKRGRKIVLIQLMERRVIEPNLLNDLHFLEASETSLEPTKVTPMMLEEYRATLQEIEKRLTMIADRYQMEYLRMTTDVPFEAVLLRALHGVGLLNE